MILWVVVGVIIINSVVIVVILYFIRIVNLCVISVKEINIGFEIGKIVNFLVEYFWRF